MNPTDNIDAGEIARFSAMAEIWWDRNGEFKALHDINPVRLAYVRDRRRPGRKGNISMWAAAAACSPKHWPPAGPGDRHRHGRGIAGRGPRHMQDSGLVIDYRQTTAEALADESPGRYDVVVCMELLEHVPRPASIIDACARLVRPGGDLFFATVNRTWLAWLLVIVAAERVLGVVRKGTHDYRKLVKPEELIQWGADAGLSLENLSGLRYIPFGGHAALCRSTAMNYLMHFRKDIDGSLEQSPLV